MKNLLPHFILENYKNNVFEGKLKAFTLFADISGFTPMTEKFMKEGNEGAEILSEILKKIFKPTVKCVYDSGGFITNFAGDSFTSLIPINNSLNISNGHYLNALHCANNILNEFNKFSSYETKFGAIDLKVRIGLSIGNVEWAIVGKDHKSFYFRGDAIETCIDAQKQTGVNEITFHINFYRQFKDKDLSFSRKGNYYCLNKFPKIPDHSLKESFNDTSSLAKQIFSRHFFPEAIFTAKDSGEFREVASVFILFNPHLSKDIIEGLFGILIEAINHYTGYLKDIDFGDKGGVIVCYFGAPVSYEEDLQRAVSFAKYLKKKLILEDNLRVLKLKIGITYGKVYTGFIGSDERIQYSVMGNAVNLCARLMSKAGWDEIWISEEVFNRIKNKSEFISIGYHQFKGFKNEIPVYKFIDKSITGQNKKSDLSIKPANHHNAFTGTMVGRAGEIEKLKTYTETIFKNNTSGIIYVTGEAGIGKSKLVKEFRKEFGKSNKVTWLYCYASEILNRPLLPFKHLLKNFFKQSSSNTAEENKIVFDNVIDIVLKRLQNLSIENKEMSSEYLQVKSELSRTSSILAAMIDIYRENSLYEQLEPQLRFENTLFAICNLVTAECMIQPVVLEMEDVHWLDNDSWEILKMLLNTITKHSLTIICTSRYILPRKKLPTDNNKVRHEIILDYLNKEDIRNFAAEILKTKIDDESADFILKNTNGNPYFIQQLTLDFKERNIWKKKNNILSLSEYDEQNIPSTINSVLVSRFDRLPENVKNTVQTASILGREFDLRVLRQMFPEDNELESKVRTAEHEKIWYPVEEGKFVFTHALLNKAVYEMQMKSEVNNLHLKAAESIKKLYGKKISHHNSEQIAYHLGLGQSIVNNKNKVILSKDKLKDLTYKENVSEYLQLQTSIADKYKADYRNERALEIYNLILSLLEKLNDKEQSYFILLKKVEILNIISKWDEAKKEVEKAIIIAANLKDKYKEMLAKKLMAEVYYYKNEYAKSEKLLNITLKYFKKSGNYSEVSESIYNLGYLNYMRGKYNEAWTYFSKNLELKKVYKNDLLEVNFLLAIGGVFTKKGDSKSAINYINKSLKISYKHNYKNQIALSRRYLGNNYFAMGLLKNSLSAYLSSLKLFGEIGNRSQQAVTLGNIGNIYFVESNYEQANYYYNNQLNIFKSINNISGIAISYGSLGMISASDGDYTKALEYYKKQYHINKILKKEVSLSASFGNMGKLYFDIGRYKSSINCFNKQYKIASKISKKDEMIGSLINLGTSFLLLRKYSRSKMYYDKAIKLTHSMEMNLDSFKLYCNYAELLVKLKKFEQAFSVCNRILTLKKHCSERELIVLFKILKEQILFLKYIKNNSRMKIKNSKHNCRLNNVILKIESNIKELSNIEYIADAYFTINEIINSAKVNNCRIDREKEFKDTAIAIHKNLLSKNEKYIYKKQLKILLTNKFN